MSVGMRAPGEDEPPVGRELFLWVALPLANFFFWFYVARSTARVESCASSSRVMFMRDIAGVELDGGTQHLDLLPPLPCPEVVSASNSINLSPTPSLAPSGTSSNHIVRHCRLSYPSYPATYLETVPSIEFDEYRAERMGSMNYPYDAETVIIKEHKEVVCNSFNHQWTSKEFDSCFAVVRISGVEAAAPIARFDANIDENNIDLTMVPDLKDKLVKVKPKFVGNIHNKGKFRPVGFFRKVPKERGFKRVKEKLQPFIQHFDGKDGIDIQLRKKLLENNVKAGDDLVVMVVNQGEIDLYLNFACSCKLHGISLEKMIVFSGSEEIVNVIESTGAMALFHEGYASVSKKASMDYLDRVFVDMMWYKAFSVYLLLRQRVNVLFQDVDLVWFKDPFPYFKAYIAKAKAKSEMSGSHPEAFFSDDGQRSLRYSPYFANSGFYYLIASERSEWFAYSIMTAFDAIQVLGSHQNTFTSRLVEGLALGHRHAVLMPMEAFPTGIMYHHDRGYMKRLRQGKVQPYNFHMCWTQGKPDKLMYLRKALMWYLSELCSPLEALEPGGVVHQQLVTLENVGTPRQERWDQLGAQCCMSVKGAP